MVQRSLVGARVQPVTPLATQTHLKTKLRLAPSLKTVAYLPLDPCRANGHGVHRGINPMDLEKRIPEGKQTDQDT
jgi:hypothetical protein